MNTELGRELVIDAVQRRKAVGDIGSISLTELARQVDGVFEENFEHYAAEGRVALGGMNRLRQFVGLPLHAPAVRSETTAQIVSSLQGEATLLPHPGSTTGEVTYSLSTVRL